MPAAPAASLPAAARSPRAFEARLALVPLALLLATLAAAWLRLPDLALRPMHGDEAIHAAKLNELWSSGRYRYDPREYHGPTLYFFAWPLAQLAGAQSYAALSEATLRLSTALFGVGLVPLLWLVRDGFDTPQIKRRAWVAWAGILCAASPIFVFYARYFIQETPLVFWTFLSICCCWRFQIEKKTGWLLGAGLGLGLMLATKETAIIALTCMMLAALAARWKFSPRDVGLAFSMATAAAVLCYSSFGRNPRGVLDAVGALGGYLKRAGGGEAQGALHRHPPLQYFEWLLWFVRSKPGPHWSEWSIALLALVGIFVVVRGWRAARGPGEQGPSWTRFALCYTVLMAVAYALIPYKTPWCALGFWHGATWLAGLGAASLASGNWWRRAAFGAVILAMSWDLSRQARAGSLNERFLLSANNPWLYAHPTMDQKRLQQRLQVLAQASGRGDAMTLIVIAPGDDYWPIPFYARALKNVGYFESVPPQLRAARPDVVIAAAPQDGVSMATQAARVLGPEYVVDEYIGLRRGVPMCVFVPRKLEVRT